MNTKFQFLNSFLFQEIKKEEPDTIRIWSKVTTKTELLKTIHKHCLICCGGSWLEVENCTSGPDASLYSTCLLWPFRLGVDPNPSASRVEAGKKLGVDPNPDKTKETILTQVSNSSDPVT